MNTSETKNLENFSSASFPQNEMDKFVPPVSPDNPPWNWLVAVAVWIGSVMLLALLPTLVVIPYMMNKGVNLQNADQMKDFLYSDYGAVLLQVGLVIPVHILTFAMSWAVVTNLRKYPFRETVGWQWGGFKIWHIGAIIAGFFVLSIILVQIFGERENDLTRILQSSRTAVYVIAFLATFTAPIVEEVVYRGIVYSAFYKAFGVIAAIIVATLLFAGVHYFQYWGDPSALIMVTLLSLSLTLIRYKTRNLLPCIILHTVFNGIQAILLILQPTMKEQADNAQQTASIIFHLFK